MNLDQETLIIIIHGIGTISCIIVGFFALKYGKELYYKGIGLIEDGSSIGIQGLNAKLKTVGSVLMLTSFAWGFLGWQIIPNYIKTDDKTQISSIDLEFFKSSTFNELENSYLLGVDSNPELTLETWKTLAENDVPQAKAVLSYAYFKGIGVEQNIDSSRAWLAKLNLEYDPFVKNIEDYANEKQALDPVLNDDNEHLE